jgi:hypothetical protein
MEKFRKTRDNSASLSSPARAGGFMDSLGGFCERRVLLWWQRITGMTFARVMSVMKKSTSLCRVLLLVLGLGIAGCGERPAEVATPEPPGSQSPGYIKIRAVRILPENPTSDNTLRVDVLFRDDKAERLSYQWLRNDIPIPGAIQSTLQSQELHKGDFISVRVWVSQMKGGGDSATSESAIIDNTAPVAEWVAIAPNPATSSDELRALVEGRDRDNDEVIYSFRWTVNGEPVVGQDGPSLASAYFHRGDKVQVTAVPFDGTDWGREAVSSVVDIQNSPPVIVSSPPERVEGASYRYPVQARDVDGDPVRFSLQGKPPAGMRIDGNTGVVEWQVVIPEREVTYEYEVVAEDPEGAKSLQRITLKYVP